MDTTTFGLGILSYCILRSCQIFSTNNTITIAAYHPPTIILRKELACYVTNWNGVCLGGMIYYRYARITSQNFYHCLPETLKPIV